MARNPSFGLKDFLSNQQLTLNNVAGIEGLDYVLKWAYLPGTIPFILVALFTQWHHKMPLIEIKKSWTLTFKQVSGAAIALFAGVGLVQLMLNSGNNASGMDSMLTEMASATANLSGNSYPFFSTLIGMLGSFMSGSATVSNILFMSFQYETASILGFPELLILSMQGIGAGIGNMICINNIVAVAATVGCLGAEGKIIRTNAIPAFIYYLLITAIIGTMIYIGFNPFAV